MKLITAEILAQGVPERWAQQYGGYARDSEFAAVGCKLKALAPAQRTPAAVNAIIGNDSWTRVDTCDECGDEKPGAVVEIGKEPDYESHTAYLCAKCVAAALTVFAQVNVTK